MGDVRINLKPLITQLSNHNEADTLLIQVADADDNIESLDARDFTQGIPSQNVERFLKAADTYVKARMVAGADAQELADRFLTEINAIEGLPSRYRVEALPGIHRNPYRISRFLRGQLEGFALYGGMISGTEVQGQAADWRMTKKGLGLALLWPLDESLPLLSRFPYLHAGLLSTVAEAEGSLKAQDQSWGDVSAFGMSLSIAGSVQYPVTSWLTVKGLVAKGFELGRTETDLNAAGKAVVTDPCHIDPAALLTEPDSVTDAIGCKFKSTVGAYKSWPWSFMVGAKFFDRVNLEFLYRYEGWDTDADMLAPGSAHNLLAIAGVDLY